MSDFPFTLSQLFQMYHRQLGYGVVAAILCALRHWHDGVPFRKMVFDSAVCACLGFGVETLLKMFSLSGDFAYLTSVMIGVLGWRVIWAGIKNRIPSIPTGSKQQ